MSNGYTGKILRVNLTTKEVSTIETASSWLVQDVRISTDLEEVRSEKEIVMEEIFREGTIPPGKVLSGYLFFPENRDADFYMFCFPLGDQLFQFVYRQQD